MKKIYDDLRKAHLTELFIMQINNQITANSIKEAIQRLCNELTEQDITECEKDAQNAVFND